MLEKKRGVYILEKNKKRADVPIKAPPHSAEEILSFRVENDILNMDGVENEMQKKRREQILESHQYKIYKGNDGRYRTYVPCDNKHGRKMIVKSSLDKLKDAIVESYIQTENDSRKKAATLESLFEEWLQYKAKHVKAASVKHNRQDWERYYVGEEIIHKPIHQLTKLDLDVFIHDSIREHQMDKHKFSNFICILRQELDYAVDMEIIDRNLLSDVRVNKKEGAGSRA